MTPEWDRGGMSQSPLFAPLQAWLTQLGETFPSLAELNALLEARPISVRSGKPLRYVPQETGKPPFALQYEPRCYLAGEVQTREYNWHDLFNALVWLAFPQAKAAINARHYQVLAGTQETAGSRRGAVRDLNTLFDESGVIVACADAELSALLRGFHWKELFWHRRDRVASSMEFCLFGHGLYEKALLPYVGMTGQGLLVDVTEEYFDWPPALRLRHLDAAIAHYFDDPRYGHGTRELTPVPLLGIPGWTVENERSGYYDNSAYFRNGRRSQGASA